MARKKTVEELQPLTLPELEEFKKCAQSAFAFSKHVKLIHPIRGKVPFDLFPFQKSVLRDFVIHPFNVVLKFRQAGLTELIALFSLWLAMFHPYKNIVIISIKDRVAKKVLRKIKFMYRNLPPYLKILVINGRTKDEIGCVTEDTMLIGEYGDFPIGNITPKQKGVKDISYKEVRVLTHKGTFEKVLKVINKGVLETWEIQNDRGRTIRCTDNHKLYTIKGWKTVREIIDTGLEVIFWDSFYLDNIYNPKTIKPKERIIKETKYAGYYVSNYGEVYTKNWLIRKSPGALCKMRLIGQGHLRVRFKLNGKGKFISVHRLVWETFNGPIQENKIIDHINCNRRDNYLSNLQCISLSENTQRAYLHNRILKSRNYQVRENISLRKLGRIKELTKKLGISYGTGTKIANKLNIGVKDISRFRRDNSYRHIYTSKIKLINITHETIVDMEVENHHSYITKSHFINHNTASDIEFSNGSIISSIPTTEEAGRSDAVSLLVIDEAAIVRWADTIWASSWPTLSTGGRAIVNSTAYGIGNFFYKLYSEAVMGQNPFNAIRLKWQMHPERYRFEGDMEWYDMQKSTLGPRKTAQEIDGDFLSSGNTVFDLSDIKEIEELVADGVIEEDGTSFKVIKSLEQGCLRIYEDPVPDKNYYMGADISTGRATDYTTFSIMDKAGDQKPCFKGKIPIDKAIAIFNKWGRKYNNALLAPESNDIGLAVAIGLQKINYPNLYYSTKLLKEKGQHRPGSDKIPGWYTTKKNRPIIIAGLETDVREGNINLKNPWFCVEAYTFIYDTNNRPVAMNKSKEKSSVSDLSEDDSYSDDSIIAEAITNHIRKEKHPNILILPQ